MKKWFSLFLASVLVLSLAACGVSGGFAPSGEKKAASGSGGANIAQNTITAMGRWVEQPYTVAGSEAYHRFYAQADGSIWCFASDTVGDAPEMHKYVSADDGITWTEEPINWGETISNSYIDTIGQMADGTMLLHSADVQARVNNSMTSKLWRVKPGEAPQEVVLTGLGEDFGLLGAELLNESTALVITRPSNDMNAIEAPRGTLINLDTGAKIADFTDDTSSPEFMSTSIILLGKANGDGNFYYQVNPTGGPDYALHSLLPDGSVETAVEKMPRADAACCDAQGNYYFTTEAGIHRIALGGTVIETIAENDTFAFAQPNAGVGSLYRTPKGDFIAQVVSGTSNEDMKMTLYRYHFDETLPAVNDTALTVWSLRESDTIRAAIASFCQANPNAAVDYIVANDGTDTAMTDEDAIRALNTELLAGGGPDILLFDDMDYNAYIQKGLLADLSTTVDTNALLPGVAASFAANGNAYVLPARFSVPILYGAAGEIDKLTSLAALQDAILACAPRSDVTVSDDAYYTALPQAEQYALGIISLPQLVHFTLQSCAPALLQDGKTDEAALRTFFSFVEAVGKHNKMVDYRPNPQSNGVAFDFDGGAPVRQMDGGSEYNTYDFRRAKYGWDEMITLSLLGCSGPQDGNGNYTNGNAVVQPGPVEGAYLPKALVGVNAASAHMETAMAFAGLIFADGVQSGYSKEGLPVLFSTLQAIEESTRPALQKSNYQGDALALCKSLKTPVLIDKTVEAKLLVHAEALCKGTETVDEAVKGVENDLALYLAEKA